MAFRPLHDRVLVRRIEAEEKTAGGIIIPDNAKEKPSEGEVVAVGGGAKAEDGKVTPLDVKAGDRVLFGKWSGTEVKLDGVDYLIMKESDIMGVLDHVAATRADGDDLALRGLLLSSVGDNDATGGLRLGINTLDNDSIV